MKKMVGFGDYMLRLNPEGYLRFLQADRFLVNYTGAEANVCVSLAMMGMDTDFVTRLPENDIAAAGVAQLRKFGVGTGHIAYGGERMGVFYVEKGASQRPSKVVYDRKYSSIAQCSYEDFDWEAIFAGASNFHMTGITPALSKTIPQVCIQACKKAKEMGLTISCDLPFAQTRWCGAAGVDAVETLSDHRDLSFGTAYGVAIKELRLLSRAVFVICANGVIAYEQIVKEVTHDVDFEAALGAVKACLEK